VSLCKVLLHIYITKNQCHILDSISGTLKLFVEQYGTSEASYTNCLSRLLKRKAILGSGLHVWPVKYFWIAIKYVKLACFKAYFISYYTAWQHKCIATYCIKYYGKNCFTLCCFIIHSAFMNTPPMLNVLQMCKPQNNWNSSFSSLNCGLRISSILQILN
jgi:hypothetical protein